MLCVFLKYLVVSAKLICWAGVMLRHWLALFLAEHFFGSPFPK